jgi:hypothetical protein
VYVINATDAKHVKAGIDFGEFNSIPSSEAHAKIF